VLLEHEDPEVRVMSLVSLGAIGNGADYEVMLATTLALSDEYLFDGVQGLRIFGDERALEALPPRIDEVKDLTSHAALEKVLDSWRASIAREAQILEKLRTEVGWDLYKTIQKLRIQSDEIRSALFELLEHEDPRARAESVMALARFNEPSDFDQLLEVTLGLPETDVVIAAQGIENFNDPRAIEPLAKYASGVRSSVQRKKLSVIVDRIRRRSTQAQSP
jgi:HEAT repeat protein